MKIGSLNIRILTNHINTNKNSMVGLRFLNVAHNKKYKKKYLIHGKI